jgi:predicted nucleotide-binding protein
VARINSELLQRIQKKLGVGRSRAYGLIDEKVRATHLPRHLAAIALASERGISISKYATKEDLAEIRHAAVSAAPRPVVVTPEPATGGATPKGRRKSRSGKSAARRRGTTVFVVHGRDSNARTQLFTFLRALGLRPLEWNQAIKKTGQPSPYVGTILDAAFQEAAAVVVLLTPDDEVRLKKKHRTPRDPGYERTLSGQARPNVLFEAGMAFGRNPQNTVLVELGYVKPFSDVAGRHVVHLSNDLTSRQELGTKLANAGCNVDMSGTDWHTAGDLKAK